jgi:aspartate aminotransferase
MPLNVNDMLTHADVLAERAPSPLARGLQGSAILKIAGEVRALKATGAPVGNFTIGDFNPEFFSIPDAFRERIKAELDAGQTNYPPAVGIPELREAIRGFYADRLGLDYPEGTVQVGAGARPPIFAAFQTILEAGDVVLYPVPTWNIRYYVYLNRAEGVPIVTRPENGFMPTAEDLLPHLSTARLIVLNSPLNPCGTVIAENLLRDICEAIVDENERRLPLGERPLMLIYDQVYWQLTFEQYTHHTPVGLVPKMAEYTVLVDAISKSWAATGLRVGWAVAPLGSGVAWGLWWVTWGLGQPVRSSELRPQCSTSRPMSMPTWCGSSPTCSGGCRSFETACWRLKTRVFLWTASTPKGPSICRSDSTSMA